MCCLSQAIFAFGTLLEVQCCLVEVYCFYKCSLMRGCGGFV
jgi:hypothetical protein